MDKLFILQLITSFIVGGAFIAILSIIAERSSEKVAGLVISLPSTVAISFFFMGWVLSPEKVAEIAPVLPIMSGVIMIFTITYLYLSKIKLSKLSSITLSTVGGLFVWFFMAVPLAILEVRNLLFSITAYVFFVAIAYYFLTIKPKQKAVLPHLKYTKLQITFRAVFAGIIITLAVFLSKVLGPFWGGVFSAFPAVFLSSFTLIYWYYDSSYLFKVWKNSPIGSIIFVSFPISAIYTFPAFGLWGGTIASYAVSVILFVILRKVNILLGNYSGES